MLGMQRIQSQQLVGKLGFFEQLARGDDLALVLLEGDGGVNPLTGLSTSAKAARSGDLTREDFCPAASPIRRKGKLTWPFEWLLIHVFLLMNHSTHIRSERERRKNGGVLAPVLSGKPADTKMKTRIFPPVGLMLSSLSSPRVWLTILLLLSGLGNVIPSLWAAEAQESQLLQKAKAAGVPPVITVQPFNVTASPNGSAAFTVTVSSQSPVGYQWLCNGVPLPGATASNFVLASAQVINAGVYHVLVSNSGGHVLSRGATLSVVSVEATPLPIRLVIYGPIRYPYEVDYKGLFDPTWTTLTNFALSSSPFTVTDESAQGQSFRSYRVIQLPALLFLNQQRRPDGAVDLQLEGEVGRTVEIRASTNLRQWTTIATITNQTGFPSFTDTNAPNGPVRFYNAVQLP